MRTTLETLKHNQTDLLDMKIFVFKPSNQLVGKFDIESPDHLQAEFKRYSSHQPVAPYDYLECQNQIWTVTGDANSLELQVGRLYPPQQEIAASPSLLNSSSVASSVGGVGNAPKKTSGVALFLTIVMCLGALFFTLYLTTDLKTVFESKDLTSEKVERAFRKWLNHKSDVDVVGVRSGQDRDGIKIAEVTLRKFMWWDGNGPAASYSGPALGYFKGYSDGKWVLKGVVLSGTKESNNMPARFEADADTLGD